MQFNSLEFLIFLPIVFIIYWVFSKRVLYQNIFLLSASYLFYGWWDYRFLGLILLSTIVDYFVGFAIYNSHNNNNRRYFLLLSIVFNLGLLGFFKYYNFFAESWITAFSTIGFALDPWMTNIILPVGISFYTFQTMSYSLDIYSGKLKPTSDFIGFATFVAFFPQLVAGPIERASNLLPQILNSRIFNYKSAVWGLRLILYGFFKKIVIADSLAPSVNEIFTNYQEYSSFTLLLGAFYFSLQIYCDFSGYSDIAIGTARLFGINLMTNFKFPYFSRSIAEFWRRWHISLSTWFRDYVYIPLGGSRASNIVGLRNVFIIFIVSGFWHGANWTFIIWGLIHALLFVPSFLFNTNRREYSEFKFPAITKNNLFDAGRIVFVFSLVLFAWVFFRSESVFKAFDYLRIMLSFQSDSSVFLNPYDHQSMLFENILITLFFIFEVLLISKLLKQINRGIRWVAYSVASFLIISAIHLSAPVEFIYFQF